MNQPAPIDYAARDIAERAALVAAIARFPETFALRSADGTFRICPRASYTHDRTRQPVLYTQCWRDQFGRPVTLSEPGEWCDYAKGTETELRAAIARA
jgi:hypothetical protein